MKFKNHKKPRKTLNSVIFSIPLLFSPNFSSANENINLDDLFKNPNYSLNSQNPLNSKLDQLLGNNPTQSLKQSLETYSPNQIQKTMEYLNSLDNIKEIDPIVDNILSNLENSFIHTFCSDYSISDIEKQTNLITNLYEFSVGLDKLGNYKLRNHVESMYQYKQLHDLCLNNS